MKTSLQYFKHAAALISAVACLSIPGMAQQSSFVLYDNFNRQFLDTNKWAPSSPCFTWTVLECVREIQNGQLRLAVRGTGATDSPHRQPQFPVLNFPYAFEYRPCEARARRRPLIGVEELRLAV